MSDFCSIIIGSTATDANLVITISISNHFIATLLHYDCVGFLFVRANFYLLLRI